MAPAAAAAPELRPVGSFEQPVSVAAPPGDQRLFVVEQTGRVRVLDASGTLLGTPFLDVAADISSGYERGLLSIAFPPDHATSRLFYVFLTAANGELQIREYRVSADDPNVADPLSARLVLRQRHDEAANHNGGGMRFGPDGQLWIAFGDGGGANNDAEVNGGHPNAQGLDTLLGKLLRIDPRGSLPGEHAIPAGNPFAGTHPGRDEIFHFGLRNHWRFSFDRATGDLIIGDVGQGAREEIDFAPAAAGRLPGANWGWPCMEGTLANAAARPAPCDPPDDRAPIHELSHTDGADSITGGVVVRDAGVPSLAGRYVYGDIGLDRLRSLVIANGAASGDRAESTLQVPIVVSIDEDGCGRVVVSSLQGTVSRLVEGAPSACPAPGDPGGGPGPGGPGGPAPGPATAPPQGCALSVTRPARLRLRTALRRGVRVAIGVRRRCGIRVYLETPGGLNTGARRFELLPGARRTLRLRLGLRTGRALRRAVRRRSPAPLRVRASHRPLDGGGAVAVRRTTVRVQR